MQLLQFSGDNTQKMTSKEIAELTGKEHSNVMRDIRNLVEELEKDKNLGGFNFELSFIINELPNGGSKQLPIYQLTKKETLLLVSGYSAILRAKIINRWEELEKQSSVSSYQIEDPIERAKAWIKEHEEKRLLERKVENLSVAFSIESQWLSILKVSLHNKVNEKLFDWRLLKKESQRLGFEVKKMPSRRFQYQNIYHKDVFRGCYPQFDYNFE
jgi:Rha family phage regulatory protein